MAQPLLNMLSQEAILLLVILSASKADALWYREQNADQNA